MLSSFGWLIYYYSSCSHIKSTFQRIGVLSASDIWSTFPWMQSKKLDWEEPQENPYWSTNSWQHTTDGGILKQRSSVKTQKNSQIPWINPAGDGFCIVYQVLLQGSENTKRRSMIQVAGYIWKRRNYLLHKLPTKCIYWNPPQVHKW
jgi:hypothetical protein